MVQEAREGVDQFCFVNVAGMNFASRSCERVLHSLFGRGSLLAILITHTHKHTLSHTHTDPLSLSLSERRHTLILTVAVTCFERKAFRSLSLSLRSSIEARCPVGSSPDAMRLSSTRSVGGKQGDIIHNDDAIVRVVCVVWYGVHGIYLSYHATD
jgi:hypothetical protein